MAEYVQRFRVRTGLVYASPIPFTDESNWHIEVQGEDTIEVHVPFSELSDDVRGNPEGTFTPDFTGLIVRNDDFTNPIIVGGPIVAVSADWLKREFVIQCQGTSYTLKSVPAMGTSTRNRISSTDATWVPSGDSYAGLVRHVLSTSTAEVGDGIKLPQCYGDLSWTAGDLKWTVELTTPPKMVWDVLEDIRQSYTGVETVFVPEFADDTHVQFTPYTGTKANPHYRKSSNLGTVDLNDGGKSIVGFRSLNDAGNRSASWFFGGSNATVKGDDDYSDTKGKWVTAPSNDPSFFHRAGGEHFDAKLSASELDDQITARTSDSDGYYKTYEFDNFYTGGNPRDVLGKQLTVADTGVMNGLSEAVRITGIDQNIGDSSSLKWTVQPRDLTVFPRVPRDPEDTTKINKPGKTGGGSGTGTVTPPVTPSSDPEITTPSPLMPGTAGTPYNANIMATGMPTPTFSLKDGDELPLGLSLSKTGQITGTPTYPSNSTGNQFTIVATNKNGTDSKLFTLVIKAATTAPVVPSGWNGSVPKISSYGSLTFSGGPLANTAFQRENRIYVLGMGGFLLQTADVATTSYPPVDVKTFVVSDTPTATYGGVLSSLPGAMVKAVVDRITDTTVNGYGVQAIRAWFTPWIVNGYVYILMATTKSYGPSVAYNDTSPVTARSYGERHRGALFRAAMTSATSISSTWQEVAAPTTSSGYPIFGGGGQIAVHGPQGKHVTITGGIELMDWTAGSNGSMPAFNQVTGVTGEHVLLNSDNGVWFGASSTLPFKAEKFQVGRPFAIPSNYIDSNGFIYETMGKSGYEGRSTTAADNTGSTMGDSIWRTDATQANLDQWTQIYDFGTNLTVPGLAAGGTSEAVPKMARINNLFVRSSRIPEPVSTDPYTGPAFDEIDLPSLGVTRGREGTSSSSDDTRTYMSDGGQIIYSFQSEYAAGTGYSVSRLLNYGGQSRARAYSTTYPHLATDFSTGKWLTIGATIIGFRGTNASGWIKYSTVTN